jgi:hypothetical protein
MACVFEFFLGRPQTPLERLDEQVDLLTDMAYEFARLAKRAQRDANKINDAIEDLLDDTPISNCRDLVRQQMVKAEQFRHRAAVYNAKASEIDNLVTQFRIQAGDLGSQNATYKAIAAITAYANILPIKLVRKMLERYQMSMEKLQDLKEDANEGATEVTENMVGTEETFDKESIDSKVEERIAALEEQSLKQRADRLHRGRSVAATSSSPTAPNVHY